jgi:uncharacterized protein (TIGR00159 family)
MIFDLKIKDVIDIFLVALILYQTYRLMKGTGAVNIFIGVLCFILFWFLVTSVFEMELLGLILNKVMSVGPILLIIIFQEEIRTFFFMVGTRNNWTLVKRLEKILNVKEVKTDPLFVMQIVTACRKMSGNNIGALIIIEHNASLSNYIETGEIINANINSRLIENIFFKNSPLHDGAVVISRGKIRSAGCILPVSHNQKVPKHLGLRHRAALGITEKTDATAIIVSEETGKISVAEKGSLRLNLSPEQLENILSK